MTLSRKTNRWENDLLVIQKFFELPEVGSKLVGPLVVDEAGLAPAGPEAHFVLKYCKEFNKL